MSAVNSESHVINFFKDQTVFLTGSTGFVGKVLVEKLLRTCPNIKLYLLMRGKKGKTTEERFELYFDPPCFEPLKRLRQDFYQQVYLINGDTTKPNLGMSLYDQELLKKEVTCIIHAAANVKFEQTLREASSLVLTTKDLIKLAKDMSNLKSFVFISTAYSNCIRKDIEEKFYDPPMTADQFLNLTSALNDDQLNAITPNILGEWPNTYVFAKCICEDVIRKESANLPISIIRPAIITSSDKEPLCGWIDNFYGVVGVTFAASMGAIASLHAKKDNIVYLVPVDHVANATLVIAEKHSILHPPNPTVPIYNIVGMNQSHMTLQAYMDYIEKYAWDYASEKVIWYYHFGITENIYLHKMYVFLWQTFPAYLIDFICNIIGKPAIAVANVSRINKLLKMAEHFSLNKFNFDEQNACRLWNELSDIDKKLFYFKTNEIDMDEWCINGIRGGRLYLLKDPFETIPKGNRKLKILAVLHYMVKAIFFYLVYKFLMLLWYLVSFLFR